VANDRQRKEIRHEVLGVVFQVRDDALQVLLWRRAQEPAAGAWSLPVGPLGAAETLEDAVARHLATKVDVQDLAHLEQLGTWSAVERMPRHRVVATAYLGLVPTTSDPDTPEDTAWHRADRLPLTAFDHGAVIAQALTRLRAKLAYTNIGFALAPDEFTMAALQRLYRAALGREISVTNLQRVLLRRNVLEASGRVVAPGTSGGRPATCYRFRHHALEVTDAFPVLRPRRPHARETAEPPARAPA
jgi:8-oxo-dGTP diphosphatase